MNVFCAISGGIDSAVATALLKKEGFKITGVFMRLADTLHFFEGEKRAKKVAQTLKIPFLVLDLRKEFKKKIVDYFLKEYKIGNTPNPCVLCNKEIKFGILLEKVLSLGADFIATGHYARIKKIDKNSGKFILLRAKDKEKDQSYFLWMLNQKQLKRILFPIGNFTRKEVENLAKKFKLPVLKAKKSVEICFIQTTINDFLKKYLKENPGLIVEKISSKDKQKRSHILENMRISDNLKVVGNHRGLWFYTIGQRKGILLSGGPYFVLDKDLKKNLLVVTKNERDLYKKELICKNVNWISGEKPKLPLKVKAKIRYKTELAKATLYPIKNKVLKVVFEKPQKAITPGQSVVFYKGEELLGGGIIYGSLD